MKKQRISAQTIAGLAIMTAIVIVLQLVGSSIHFGPFSISLVLLPIVVGAALYGPLAGAWLGFVFSLVVLIVGDAAAFLAINVFGTIVTVILKGTLAGLVAGLVYKAFSKPIFKNQEDEAAPEKAAAANREQEKSFVKSHLGVILAAITCPVINTGLFLVGCAVFFLPTLREWGLSAGYENVTAYMFLGLVGGNFLVELLINLLLSPVIVQLIRIGKRRLR